MADRKQQRQLLGYLLGSLDASEKDRINQRLANDPILRKGLAKAEASLELLRAVPRVHRPPAGLAARTCRRVFGYSEALCHATPEGSPMQRPARQRARVMSPAAVPPSSVATWGWSDLVTAVAVFLAVSCSIFPAILRNRASTRLVACQDHLRQIGMSQGKFQDFHQTSPPSLPADTRVPAVGLPVALFLNQPGMADLNPMSPVNSESPAPPSTPLPSAPPRDAPLFGHQGFTQVVQGQNLLFLDGRVTFMAMGPVFGPDDANSAGDDPPFAAWPIQPGLPAGGATAFAPIVHVSRLSP